MYSHSHSKGHNVTDDVIAATARAALLAAGFDADHDPVGLENRVAMMARYLVVDELTGAVVPVNHQGERWYGHDFYGTGTQPPLPLPLLIEHLETSVKGFNWRPQRWAGNPPPMRAS